MIQLIISALRKPITIIVLILGVMVASGLAIRNMKMDIFPTLGLPVVYVAQPYGGLSPRQMEGMVTSYYEYHFLYITGIKSVTSKSIQGASLMKLEFHEDIDMNQAMAEVVGQVNRSRAFMPPGTVPPFIVRFDAGSVPVGQLVFESKTRSLGEIQDLALFRVRPMFSSLPGVSAPPPFGGSAASIVVNIDPERLRSYRLSPDKVVESIASGNYVAPAGNVRVGDYNMLTPANTIVQDPMELGNIPIKKGAGPTVFVKDVAEIRRGTDIISSYALVNGKRAVYIPVTKRANASTWDVVQTVKKNLPQMQAAVPEDIEVSYEFDQSGYVINSLRSLTIEGVLGAMLTGLMVLLFLGDRRTALIVITTIPLAILSGLVGLWLTGQTLNIMTLGGLALAVGILVDEATVTVENIHAHMETGKSKVTAIFDACKEIAVPKLLILLSILAVFVPSFFMSGTPKAMFVPLCLAVGFSMIASFLLSQTYIPILSNWILREHPKKSRFENRLERMRENYKNRLAKILKRKNLFLGVYLMGTATIITLGFLFIGLEIFPKVDAGQFQLRMRAKTGTRIERTEQKMKEVLSTIDELAGKENIEITSAFIGVQPSSFPVNLIHLWTSGPHEGVVRVKMRGNAGISLTAFKERLRNEIRERIPDVQISFEPADLVDMVMSQGALTPIEINVTGSDLTESIAFAEKIKKELDNIAYLRDIQYAQPLDYPAYELQIDRERAGQLGFTVSEIANSVTPATSSSRFTQPVYWIDFQGSGNAYQVQVEVPQHIMNSPEDVQNIPLTNGSNELLKLGDMAKVQSVSMIGEYDRLNMARMVTLTANVHDTDLGTASSDIQKAIGRVGEPPRGHSVIVKGQLELLQNTLAELELGLVLAIVVIFLMLAANFQSFKLSGVVLATVPAVLSGSIIMLLATGTTLNIQSFMGTIMALGVSVANAILLVYYAEINRNQRSMPASDAVLESAHGRIRPILMTTLAMVAGMLPLSLGIGEGGEQTAPLGRAVIGGLIFSTITVLYLLPVIYQAFMQKSARLQVSLDPTDPESKFYEPEKK